MSDTPRRLYTEKEIGALLKRATELQEEAHESRARSLSFEEIEQIAAEIGIAPEHLQMAAAELADLPTSDETSFLFFPNPITQKRVIDGKLTEAEWEQFVLGIRRLTGGTGKVTEIGQIREWSRNIQEIGSQRVTLSPHGEQTLMEVRQHYWGGALIAYVFSFTAGMAIGGVMMDGNGMSDGLQLLIAAGGGVGMVTAVRIGIGLWVNKQRERVKHLASRLQNLVGPREQAVSEPAPALALPEDDAHLRPEAVAEKQRVRS